jgi:hypothetical protein
MANYAPELPMIPLKAEQETGVLKYTWFNKNSLTPNPQNLIPYISKGPFVSQQIALFFMVGFYSRYVDSNSFVMLIENRIGCFFRRCFTQCLFFNFAF